MKKHDVTKAIEECKRFIAACEELSRANLDSADKSGLEYAHDLARYTAAVRRASMDATRALANLRRRAR
jgi:hypothetical protein